MRWGGKEKKIHRNGEGLNEGEGCRVGWTWSGVDRGMNKEWDGQREGWIE